MKTTISKENILKSGVLFLITSALLFTSCSENLDLDTEMTLDDTTLIKKIESASKTTVEVSSLPSATETALNGDLADSYVETVQLAAGLGYKVGIATDNESREDAKSDVYFSVEGKQLADRNEKRKKRRSKCFEFVFHIDFIMQDDTSITLTSSDDWILIREWYTANPDTIERPELVFPVDVSLEDGTVQTLIDNDELAAVKDSCKKGKDKRKCFKLVLPVSFTMADASVIEVTERSDFKLLREWFKANPDATEKASLSYPVDIMYRDGTTATISDATEMDTAKKACN